jgi:PucR family transcriptional regulator, proline-responsive transcriptional activator
MSITVLEATKLETFKNFRLVAGHRGLDNIVEKIGILDWEFITKLEGHFIEGEFAKGEFVLSSLLFAKDKPELVIEAVKYLVESQVSGLAIKNIYYNDLPNEVINYANEKSVPIFIFDNSVYFEDIITETMDKIRSINNYELLETKVDLLIKMNLNKALIRDIAFEINSSFKECIFVLYFKEKKFIGDNKIVALIEKLKRNKSTSLYDSILKYGNGILIISTYEKIEEKDFKKTTSSLLKDIGINHEEYYIGISNLHKSLNELGNCINESIFAQKTGEVSSNSLNYFSDIGVYSILMPYINETWIHNFHNRIIKPIINYDEKYNTELFNTAIKYIENDGKVNETANEIFLHKNTVRYRINKIKELLNMNDCEGSFYEQLSIAIKLYKIYNI